MDQDIKKEIKHIGIQIEIAQNQKTKALIDLGIASRIIDESNHTIADCEKEIRILKGGDS